MLQSDHGEILDRFPTFQPFFKATFIERPNRFLVRCQTAELGVVDAFLPNPGRLRELLFPGVTVFVKDSASEGRKTRYTVIAVERAGAPVFLHTHINNRVARHLLDTRRIPGLEGAKVLQEEVCIGRSRFDFLLQEERRETLLEVKSVTLFGHGVAMFPDAVTERGRRHLIELAEMSTAQHKHAVLFLVHAPAPRVFLPDYHTDLSFSRTLYEVRDHLRILPVGIGWTSRLSLQKHVRQLTVPWDAIAVQLEDRGNFVAILHAPGDSYQFWVAYAQNNLSKIAPRQARESWKPKSDGRLGAKLTILPIRGAHDRSKALNKAFARHFPAAPADHGPVFSSPRDPERTEAFQRVLLRYRLTAHPR